MSWLKLRLSNRQHGLMTTMQLRITGYPTYRKNKVFIFSKETNLTDQGCWSGVSFSLFIYTGLGREVLLFHFVLSNTEAVFKLHLFPWCPIVYLCCMLSPCAFLKADLEISSPLPFPLPTALWLNLLSVLCVGHWLFSCWTDHSDFF